MKIEIVFDAGYPGLIWKMFTQQNLPPYELTSH